MLPFYVFMNQNVKTGRNANNSTEDETFISSKELAKSQELKSSALSNIENNRHREQIQRQLEYFNSWDSFYRIHGNQFFKDRHYLHLEHLSLARALNSSQSPIAVLDFGCGVGNSILPLLEKSCGLVDYLGVDISRTAVDILRNKLEKEPVYRNKLRNFQVHELDLTLPTPEAWTKIIEGFPVKKFDFCLMVFTLSAFHPARMQSSIERCINTLKQGSGVVCLRDYSEDDLAKFRFPPGQRLGRNWYVRQDGTFSFFFSRAGLIELFTRSSRMQCRWIKQVNRKISNRADDMIMYRSWIGCEFVALHTDREPLNI